MKILAAICNFILIGFTCFVILTDGAPHRAAYIVFSLLLVSVPLFNLALILRKEKAEGRPEGGSPEEKRESHGVARRRSALKIAAVICNAVLLAFACWAIMDQYPHPREAGFIEYIIFVMLTPVLSSVVIARGGRT